MRNISILFILVFYTQLVSAQTFNFALTGNPVNTTGWDLGTQSYVNNDELILTDPTGNQAGYIYYSTPQNLASCSQFTIQFDFRITNSSSPTADGIAFWYISNPPSAFVSGGGLGLPSNPNGLVLLLDTYNNNGVPNDNPLISLRNFNGTSNYTEGDNTGQLAPDLPYQSFVIDGTWHTCKLIYSFGTVTVSFDGNPPVMTGTTTLNINGYFGFSASTGALWAQQSIKNVTVSGAPEPDPPLTDSVAYCQYETPAPLSAPGANLKWYTSATGGAALPGAPTPSTSVPGTFIWYVSAEIPGCNIESERSPLVVTIHSLPAAPTVQFPIFCSGAPGQAITITSGNNVLWYADSIGGIGDPAIPNVSTTIADTLAWYITQTDTFGCESLRSKVETIVHQAPVPDFNFTLGLACDGDTVHFANTSTFADSYHWDFYDGQTDTILNPVHIYADPGDYYVILKAYNKFCTDSVVHTVSLGHALAADFSTSEDTVCQGSLVSFTNLSTATTINGVDPQYSWDFGDGGSSSLQNPQHLYATPGVYNVRMIINNAVPCYDTSNRVIFVDSLGTLNLMWSDTPICKGNSIDLDALLVKNGLNTLSWNFGDSPDSVLNQNPIHHAYDQEGIYTITVRADYRVCPDTSLQAQIRVKDVPVIHIGADTSLCLDGNPYPVSDLVNANNPLATWRWNTGDTTSSIFIYHPGLYSATITIDQCSATDEMEVRKDCYLDVPNSFTPDGNGVNDYFLPRQLLSKGVVSFQMTIWNRWGQTVFETINKNGRGWDGRFNDKSQPMGVYIYEIKVVFKNGREESYTGNVTLIR
jgi:gliding motility-associated-like protein